jgi:hypothetical protein
MVQTRVTNNSSTVKVNVVGGSRFGIVNKISAERTYNMFITTAGVQGADDFEAWMMNYPGYARVLNLLAYPDPYPSDPPLLPSQVPAGSGRGIFNCVRGDFMIIVVGDTVFRVGLTLTVLTIGTLNTRSGEVFIADNLNGQICIVDGLYAYIYNYQLPPNLSVQTDGALGDGSLIPNYVEYHNTFFLFGNANTTAAGAFWYAYSFNNNTSGAADNISENSQMALQTKADFAIAVKRIPAQGNNVIVFGTTVSEIQTQVGGLLNYQRNPSHNINYGCQSVSTIAESGNTLAWLAVNENDAPVIMVYDEQGMREISTDGINYQLDRLVEPRDSTAMLYRQNGHLFYQLTFFNVNDNVTFVYDFNTEMFFHLTDQYMNYHPARNVVYFDQSTYFVGLNNAALYKMDQDFTTIDENIIPRTADEEYNYGLVFNIPRERITSNIRQSNSGRFIANSFVITLEQGMDENYSQAQAEQGYHIITEVTNSPPLTDMITEDEENYIVASNIPGVIDPYFNPNLLYTPHIDMAISKDGGVTWSNYVRRNMHYMAHRQNILHWENMGAANDLCFKLRFWGTSRFVVNNAELEIIV